MAAPPSLLDDDGQPSSGSPLTIGQVVCGKYRIERQIGRGGMGIVLAATHLHLGNLVAIKVMRRDLLPDDRALDRLLMEARAAARVRSDHVARVLDVGMLDSGSPFIVMEYLEGENLADLLDRQGALGLEEAASFMMQCCLALAEVHVAGMIHRDLKPGNIFIARQLDGSATVKIVDFGISKHIGDGRERGAVTSPQVLGSPFYMSPEQMRADSVDERSDIWGLGAILFEMLTGRPPFLGDTLPEVYSAVLNHAPPQVDSLRPGVPAELDDVVQRCLEKDPARRYQNVAELAGALAPFAGAMGRAVERVSRILTSVDVSRARSPVLPDGTAAAIRDEHAERLSLQPGPLQPGPAGAGGMSAATGERSSSPEHDAREAFEPGAALPRTMLEGDMRSSISPPALDASWRPSSANTGELSPLAATGAGVRARRGGRGRGVLVFLASCAAVVGAAALLWPRFGSSGPAPGAGASTVDAPGTEGTASSETQPSEPTPSPSGASGVPSERSAEGPGTPPRVTPLAGRGRTEPADAPPIVEVRALRPVGAASRAKPAAPAAAATRSTGSDPGSSLWSAQDEPAPREAESAPGRSEPEPPGGTTSGASSGAARRPLSTPDDAWNPDAFGDRR
jgi:eukaryotic-like serine/threonine-protein kinase